MKLAKLAAAGSTAVLLAFAAAPSLAQESETETTTTEVREVEEDEGFDEWGLLGLLGLAGLLGLRKKDEPRRDTGASGSSTIRPT